MMKPVYASLRRTGHSITGFLDDMLIVADSDSALADSVQRVLEMLQTLGFVINFEKSALQPTTKISYLGFEIESKSMVVTLPDEKKKEKIVLQAKSLLQKSEDTIRNVAEVIGSLVACFPAVQTGPLHYRNLEKEKDDALRQQNGNFDAHMAVSATMKQELQWWIGNVYSQRKVTVAANPEVIITSDASLEGRGCSCLNEKTGGRWNEKEKQWHINYLELLGAFHALQSFQDKLVDKHVQLLLDKTTAVAYVNHMGGKQPSLNDLTLWSWCLAKIIWLSAAHIPGVNNVDADFESRHFYDRCEWSLDNRVFHNLSHIFGQMDIDLFASRLNAKCQRYVAW